jgi:hypothetical protein
MKPIKVHGEDILKAVTSGDSYIEIGTRKFMLFEVEQVPESDCYTVTDTHEERLLLEALEGENPILSESEINKMLDTTRPK